jgi:hypothetical protein
MDGKATQGRKVGEIGAMKAAREEDVCRRSVAERDAALEKRLCVLLGLLLVAAFAMPGASALAQDSGGGGNPFMPKMSIGGEQKRKLTPEEEERQRQIDADYKAANSKIPTQKALDPWADVRQAPATSGPKASASTHNASAQKKKQSAQQPQ